MGCLSFHYQLKRHFHLTSPVFANGGIPFHQNDSENRFKKFLKGFWGIEVPVPFSLLSIGIKIEFGIDYHHVEISELDYVRGGDSLHFFKLLN